MNAFSPLSRRLSAALAGATVAMWAPPTLFAQTVPIAPQVNPGIVTNQKRQNQQQIQQQTEQTLEGPAVVAPKAPPVAIPPSGGQTFLLKGVKFDTSAFLSKEELDAIARPYIGTRVDISQIQRIVKAVNDLFAEKGIVTASACLPPQDLKKTGELRIAIVEGKLGTLKVTGNTRLRTDSSSRTSRRSPAISLTCRFSHSKSAPSTRPALPRSKRRSNPVARLV